MSDAYHDADPVFNVTYKISETSKVETIRFKSLDLEHAKQRANIFISLRPNLTLVDVLEDKS